MSGWDEENRPIFISTWGKFDMRKIVNEGRETMEAFEKYTRQAGYNVIRSHKIRSTPEKPVHVSLKIPLSFVIYNFTMQNFTVFEIKKYKVLRVTK